MDSKLIIIGVFLIGINLSHQFNPLVISANVNCNIRNEWDIVLGPREQSVVVLKATNGSSYRPFGNCKFNVKTLFNTYGVIAYVQEINLRRNFLNTCTDYVTITDNFGTSTKNCNKKGGDHYMLPYNGNLIVNFFTDRSTSSTKNRNFEIIFTQYRNGVVCLSNEFECRNHRCIYENLRCDGRNNCGDNSDEDCPSKVGRIVGGIFGAIAIIAIAVAFALFMRRRRSTVTRTTTTTIGGGLTNPLAGPVAGTYPAQQTAYPPQPNAYQAMPPQYQAPPQYQQTQQYPPPQQYPSAPQQYGAGPNTNAYPTK